MITCSSKKNTQRPTILGSNIPEEKPNIPEEKNKSNEGVGDKRKNKEELNPLDSKMINFIDALQKEEDNRVTAFFKGIAPSVERFKDDDIVEFQYQVLNRYYKKYSI